MSDTPEKFDVAAAERQAKELDRLSMFAGAICVRQACARIRELEDERNDYMSLAVKYCNELRNIEREWGKVMIENKP